jgi:hypothetical protein
VEIAVRLKLLPVTMVTLTLGGCLGLEAVPAVTGSLNPEATTGLAEPTSRSDSAQTTLADAVTSCLARRVPVKTAAFRSCVSDAQEATAPRANATPHESVASR